MSERPTTVSKSKVIKFLKDNDAELINEESGHQYWAHMYGVVEIQSKRSFDIFLLQMWAEDLGVHEWDLEMWMEQNNVY